ncbi:ribonucleotide-diphosphate reductase subunit beta [Methanobrevibacter sp. TMH8]|uniref:Brix domain-containing protein n=1 Tax=Methanobrevibacter sp. TMH8 TaxID=2848611 RepID=UPI001CCFD0FF|nr:ribonucleotide-diphosphate reductase subunit beta [Methanobrevibacter sp. TMH8]MBZ9571359.1 ribonucleotide-diphosphate reductase subunit beta [Methanobrevibacter sp. TMH8]
MLISTSRKPSSKTRAFCKNLSHALDCQYINRGKMSLRELQLKSAKLGSDFVVLVYEMKGNPSKITFLSNDGDELLVIMGSVNTTNQRLNIKTDEITFKSDLPEFNILKDIFPINNDISLNHKSSPKENFIHVEKIEKEYSEDIEEYEKKIAIIHFYNKFGKDTGLKINVRKVLAD